MQRLEVSGAVRPLHGSLGVKGLIWCFTADGTRATWVWSGVSNITMVNILLKLALHFFQSLHNSFRLDSVFHKATWKEVPRKIWQRRFLWRLCLKKKKFRD